VLEARARGAAVLVPVVVLVIAAGQPVLGLAVAVLAAAAATETYALLRRAGWPSSPPLGVAIAGATTLLLALGDDGGPGLGAPLAPLLLLALGVAAAAVAAFAQPDPREGVATWLGTVFGAAYVVPLGFAGRLASLGPAVGPGALLAPLGPERAWVALLVLTVWAYDTGAYLVGSRYGRRRFLSHLSPSKTEAGLVGGLVAATAVATLGFAAAGTPPTTGLLFGPLVGLAAQGGDLAESMLKRAAGVKDSGRLIPGHGGILDRADAFVVAAPVAAFLLAVLGR
jgi:phosphatidate cytidylyltransferase